MATTVSETIRLAVAETLSTYLNDELRGQGLPKVPVEAVNQFSDYGKTEKLPRVFVSIQGWQRIESTIGEDGFQHEEYAVIVTHGVKSADGVRDVTAFGFQLHDCIKKVLEVHWDLPVPSCPEGQADEILVVSGSIDPLATQAESNFIHFGEVSATVRITRQLQTHGGE